MAGKSEIERLRDEISKKNIEIEKWTNETLSSAILRSGKTTLEQLDVLNEVYALIPEAIGDIITEIVTDAQETSTAEISKTKNVTDRQSTARVKASTRGTTTTTRTKSKAQAEADKIKKEVDSALKQEGADKPAVYRTYYRDNPYVTIVVRQYPSVPGFIKDTGALVDYKQTVKETVDDLGNRTVKQGHEYYFARTRGIASQKDYERNTRMLNSIILTKSATQIWTAFETAYERYLQEAIITAHELIAYARNQSEAGWSKEDLGGETTIKPTTYWTIEDNRPKSSRESELTKRRRGRPPQTYRYKTREAWGVPLEERGPRVPGVNPVVKVVPLPRGKFAVQRRFPNFLPTLRRASKRHGWSKEFRKGWQATISETRQTNISNRFKKIAEDPEGGYKPMHDPTTDKPLTLASTFTIRLHNRSPQAPWIAGSGALLRGKGTKRHPISASEGKALLFFWNKGPEGANLPKRVWMFKGVNNPGVGNQNLSRAKGNISAVKWYQDILSKASTGSSETSKYIRKRLRFGKPSVGTWKTNIDPNKVIKEWYHSGTPPSIRVTDLPTGVESVVEE